MQTVYKYEIPVGNYFEIRMPKNAKILTVQMKQREPFIWALVDTNEKPEIRKFWLVGTGYKMDGMSACTSIQIPR